MRFPESLLTEIKARIPVSEVVGRRVKLKRQGREWAGLSPFNAEKTPSFFVNDQKAFYHDFSSGKHGDIFTFVMETEGLSFPEAVEQLAAQAGVPLPPTTPEVREREDRRRDLHALVDTACRYFEKRLQSTDGAAARNYLAKRSIVTATQAEFRLGLAPDSRDGLKRFLAAQGATSEQMMEAGLLVSQEDGRAEFDRFRQRLMIPIQDMSNRVIGFGGRTLLPEGKPKYLNSPATELFQKGEIVFNSHRARSAAHESGTVLVVEGYLDAIAVWQAGFPAVVATLGTAFSEGQIAALWRIAPQPIICFDGDRAGLAAAARAIDRILPLLTTGRSFHFAYLPLGRDPDDLVRDGGLDALQAVLMTAKPLWDVLWTRETAEATIATPDGRAVLEKRLSDITQAIADQRVQRFYRDQVRQSLRNLFFEYDRRRFDRGPSLQSVKRSGQFRAASAPSRSRTPAFGAIEKARYLSQEKIFLGLCIEFPHLIAPLLDELTQLRLRGRDQHGSHDDFLNEIIRIHHESGDLQAAAYYSVASPRFTAVLDDVHGRGKPGAAYGHQLLRRFPILKTKPPADFIARSIRHFLNNFMSRELEDEIRELTAIYPEADEEAFEGRLNARRASLMALNDRIRAEESALAEEAASLQNVPISSERPG
jgi:DNA primase